jgi:hypothetical protein
MRMQDEHDDDLAPSVGEHGEVETEDFPKTADDIEEDADDEESDDQEIIGK